MSQLISIRFTGDRTLKFTSEDIDALFDTYEIGAYTFMILSLLYPDLRYSQKGFHQDHMNPHTAFEDEKIARLKLQDGSNISPEKIEEWQRRRNTLANLQLLEGRENEVKNKTPLVAWLNLPENMAIVKYLPKEISYSLDNFEEFMDKRQELMGNELKKILLV